MHIASTFVLLLFPLQLHSASPGELQREERETTRTGEPPLSVLLLSSFFTGHQIPMVSIGGEMVSRGHNVSLFTTEVEGSHVVPQLVERVGITFLSAGPESRTREDIEREMHRLREKGVIESVKAVTLLFLEHLLCMRQSVDRLTVSDWDIVLVDVAQIAIARYIALRWPEVPVVVYNVIPMVFPSMEAPWPYLRSATNPGAGTLWDRLESTWFYGPALRLGFWIGWNYVSQNDPVLAQTLGSENPYLTVGIANPVIGSTAFEFEYPRPLLPAVHLVGPVPLKLFPPLDQDLEEWLRGKQERRVVYISMGSTAYLTSAMAQALIEGIRATDYDAVWSLRETNRDILLESSYPEKSRFYLSTWVSQQALLQHEAIGVSILHGGMNGVQESIYYGVPVIAIPFGLDQPLVSSRVQQLRLGVQILSSELTAELVAESIHRLQSEDYRARVERQSKFFRYAGGTGRVADILEHYADVGYEHLYPAFYKYDWTWVQYYNADVYLVLGLAFVLIPYCTYRSLKLLLRFCCVPSKRRKQE